VIGLALVMSTGGPRRLMYFSGIAEVKLVTGCNKGIVLCTAA